MLKNKFYFIVNKEFFDNNDDDDMLLATYMFLQCHGNTSRRVFASLESIVWQCGYCYGYTDYAKQSLNNLRQSLETLREMGYIDGYYYPNKKGKIKNLDTVKDKQSFIIMLNADEVGYGELGSQYLCVPIEHYLKIIDYCHAYHPAQLKKYLKLYCYISFMLGPYPDAESRTIENIKKHPNYFRTTLKALEDNTECAMGVKTVMTVLSVFEELEIFHSNHKINMIDMNKDGSFINIGKVFVRHSENWQLELECAVKHYQRQLKTYQVAYQHYKKNE